MQESTQQQREREKNRRCEKVSDTVNYFALLSGKNDEKTLKQKWRKEKKKNRCVSNGRVITISSRRRKSDFNQKREKSTFRWAHQEHQRYIWRNGQLNRNCGSGSISTTYKVIRYKERFEPVEIVNQIGSVRFGWRYIVKMKREKKQRRQ